MNVAKEFDLYGYGLYMMIMGSYSPTNGPVIYFWYKDESHTLEVITSPWYDYEFGHNGTKFTLTQKTWTGSVKFYLKKVI